jgi:hypothetical protein
MDRTNDKQLEAVWKNSVLGKVFLVTSSILKSKQAP